MSFNRLRLVALGVVALGATTAAADAQVARLGRLDVATRHAVVAVIDSAIVNGLPAELSDELESRALQASVMSAMRGEDLVAFVRQHAALLVEARRALGSQATIVEIESGAAALDAGAQPATLAALRRARGGNSVELPLIVLTDFLTREVPADTAVALVLRVADSRADDVDDAVWHNLRLAVVQDISAGKTPVIAATTRTRGVLGSAAGAASAVTLDQTTVPGTRGGAKPVSAGPPPEE